MPPLARRPARVGSPWRGRRATIATLGLSGLRAHEVAGLRRRHLDFTHGRIVIEDGKTHGSVREVHISPFLREELLVYVADLTLTGADDLLFPTKRGTPHSRQNLNRRVLAPPSRAPLRRGPRAETRSCRPRSPRTPCAGPS